MERDISIRTSIHKENISTHTLTWSVTNLCRGNGVNFEISTHTLTWSVTFSMSRLNPLTGDFNSHAHVERDSTLSVLYPHTPISTHTLTWSVTTNVL